MADNRPSGGMKAAAKRALAWKEQGHAGGTAVGLNRAHQIVSGENLSDSTVKRMFSFFSRHEVDKKAKGFSAGEEGYPSPGRVAWDLWGGDAGFSWSRKKVNSMKKELAEEFIVNEIKKSFEEGIQNKIGGTSSVNEVPHNASHAEYYERSSQYIADMIKEGGNDMSTTEPDPTGDIAVTKSMDSTLARRKIKKAMKALEKAMASLPDVGRAGDVSVSNETAPVAKASGGDPDVSRADSVTVSNETGPSVQKDMTTADGGAGNQGMDQKIAGEGEYSVAGNPTVPSDAAPMTKAAGTCSECGDSCGEDETKCSKCMKMEKSSDGDDKEPDDDEDDKVEKADKCPDCGKSNADCTCKVEKADKCPDCGKSSDDCTCKVYKSAQDLINEAKLSKSVWGGAFGTPNIPRVQ